MQMHSTQPKVPTDRSKSTHYTHPEVYEYISRVTDDPIVEWRTCAVSGTKFPIFQKDHNFYTALGRKLGEGCEVPYPTLCPEERCRRRLSRQNMRTLYRRTCDATGKFVISNISASKPMPVYVQPYRWSDAWDFRDYGRDIDFNRPFFEQFHDLLSVTPQPNLMANYLLDHNSDYTNYAGGNKNCYLIFHADMNEDCMFGVGVKKCKRVIDTIHTHSCELMYECIDARNCHDCKYSQNIEQCAHSNFLKNCMNCSYCTGCVNMTNKQYCFFNEQLTKEVYFETLKSCKISTHSGRKQLAEKFDLFAQSFPVVALEQYQSENCTGDLIFRSRDVHCSFDIQESDNVRYSHRVYNGPNENVYDVNEYGMQISNICEGLAIGINAHTVMTGIYVNEEVRRVWYSMHVHHSHDMFGCISAINGSYCILNKQYTKEDYQKTVTRLAHHMQETGEWGEFFPASMSPYGYDETVAHEYYPLSESQAIALGLQYSTKEKTIHDVPYPVIDGSMLPECIDQVDDDILQKVLRCEVTGKLYRIIKQELEYYRAHDIPLPRVHPDERHLIRRRRRPKRALYLRECDRTGEEMVSVYPPDFEGTVYSEKAYQEEVYG